MPRRRRVAKRVSSDAILIASIVVGGLLAFTPMFFGKIIYALVILFALVCCWPTLLGFLVVYVFHVNIPLVEFVVFTFLAYVWLHFQAFTLKKLPSILKIVGV